MKKRKLMTYSDGSYYQGEVNEDGERHGKGLLRWSREEYYFGDWDNGDMSGKGVHIADNVEYEGDWLNDHPHGRGVCRVTPKEGDEVDDCFMTYYEGEWKEDERCGRGYAVFADRSTYEGEFRDDCINGKGVLRYPSGRIEEGEWKDGALHGYGTIYFPEDEEFSCFSRKGEWDDCKINGPGEVRWRDGSVWTGNIISTTNGKVQRAWWMHPTVTLSRATTATTTGATG